MAEDQPVDDAVVDWSGALAGQEPVEARAVPDVLVGRSGDCGALDELVEAICQGLSRSLVRFSVSPASARRCLLE